MQLIHNINLFLNRKQEQVSKQRSRQVVRQEILAANTKVELFCEEWIADSLLASEGAR